MQIEQSLVQDISQIWTAARTKAFTLVNKALTDAYWAIGQRIMQAEQKGHARAEYGSYLLKELSRQLTQQHGKGFDERELRRMRQFFTAFPNRGAMRPELTWSHYRLLLRVESPQARLYYMNEAADQGWATRTLDRNIGSLYFERIVAHRRPSAVTSPSATGAAISADDLIKDPYVLEFLRLDVPTGFSENELESAILSKLQHFLLEMGKGFSFVGRQYSIKTDTAQYYIDLVFYNYILRAFILVDLKIAPLTHQDIGQMDMYVRMFEDLRKGAADNPTIGIILCTEKDATLVKYSVLEENKQLFASTYRLLLPTEEELTREIDQAKYYNQSQ
ncbi:MAG TPA: PDDEXK nuclease domain-containing protein [Puia sp.]|uniref:PDDEXK nuclease domain-containing protein n=1 Tax=Puia sp. TaxID=2045100 RepID=UPI002B6A8DAE|nr:PDDEXK nuclease domain-containing protein [Puia sp.]HVU97738.1 PDDEXK nuclease domain-containing protein [Puia sp.]